MGTRLMGIEIGNTHIKMLEVVKSGARIEIEKFSLLKTPPNCFLDGVISQVEPIKKVISEELKVQKYRSKKVVAVIQSSQVITRNIIMEKHSEKMIKPLLQMKIETFLPIESDQYQMDFKILGEVEEEQHIKNKWMVVAAPKTIVVSMTDLLKGLKLRPLSITIPSEALQSVLHPSIHTQEELLGNILVIDLGGKSTTVTILTEKETYLTRRIAFGMEHLHEKSNEIEGYLVRIFRPQIEYNILAEIERILQFYYSNQEAEVIEKIYLIGGGANLQGIKSYIRDALNIPVETIESLELFTDKTDRGFKYQISFFVNVLGAIQAL